MSYLRQLLDPNVIAAWVQALGSIFAIVWSAKGVDRTNQLSIARERRRAAEKLEHQIQNVHALILHTFEDLKALCDDPDEPYALARAWRERSNDSVPLALAQLQYDLDQLVQLPALDNPALKLVQRLVYSLLVVKDVLEREDDTRPVDEAGRRRISKAAWDTKKHWGLALVVASKMRQVSTHNHQSGAAATASDTRPAAE